MVLQVYSTRKFLALLIASILVGSLPFSLLAALPFQNQVAEEPSFTISASPTSLSVFPGSTGTFILQVRSMNGFFGTVDLDATLSQKVSNGPRLAWGRQVTLTELGTGSTTLTVSTVNNALVSTRAGLYEITVTGTSGSRSQSSLLSLNVADFVLFTGNTGVGIPAGSIGSLWVTLASASGFAGEVDLTASVSPLGLASSLNPSRVNLASGDKATSMLSLGPMPARGPLGQFSVTVTGHSSGVSHSNTVMVAEGQDGPDFSIVCCWPTNDGSISVFTGESHGSLASISALNNFTGSIFLTVNLPFPASVNPSTISLPWGQNGTMTVMPDLSISIPGDAAPGVYGGTLTGNSGSISHTLTLSVTVVSPPPDFTISLSETLLNIPQDSSATSTITLTSLNGFSGSISFSSAVYPQTGYSQTEESPQVSIDPTTVTLTAEASETATLTVVAPAMPPGSNSTHFQIIVTGSSQSSTGQTISHSTAVDVYVIPRAPDFLLEAEPNSITLSPGTSGSFHLTITSLNGFTGQILLSTSLSLPTVIQPSEVTLPPDGTAEATLTVSVPPGTSGSYGGSVTATGDDGFRNAGVNVNVLTTQGDPDFDLVASPQSIGPIVPGEKGDTTISVNPLRGFTGNVTISAYSNSSSGLVFSLDRTWVMFAGSITLTASATALGNYTVVVTGTSGTLTHTIYILVTVESSTTSVAIDANGPNHVETIDSYLSSAELFQTKGSW